jgi:FMN reductase
VTTRRIAVVRAGLSNPSSTRLLADRLAAAATAELRESGIEADVTVVELREHARALADHLLTGFPAPELESAIAAVEGADGVIAVTPVFSASYSGLFKTFFDVIGKDALTDRPVLLGATAGTARHSLVIDHAMRPLFAYLRAAVLPTGVFAASEDWGAAGAEAALNARIGRAGRELAHAIARREQVAVTDPFEVPASFTALLAQS